MIFGVMLINIFSYTNICVKLKLIFNGLRFLSKPVMMDQYVNFWYGNGGIDSSGQLHYRHILTSPSTVSIAAFEGDLDILLLVAYDGELPSVVVCCMLLLS